VEPSRRPGQALGVGEDGDGGYLVPDDLSNIDGCFSAGSDGIMHFEKHLASEYRIKSYILDKIDKKPLELSDLQEFRHGWLGVENNQETVTLERWLIESNLDKSRELLLQMDIEGAEYRTLLCTPTKILERFRIIVVEFHGLDKFTNYNLLTYIFLSLLFLLIYFYYSLIFILNVLLFYLALHINLLLNQLPNVYYVLNSFLFAFNFNFLFLCCLVLILFIILYKRYFDCLVTNIISDGFNFLFIKYP
jgi:hypothetical protein